MVVILLAIVGFIGYNGVNTINSELDSILTGDVPMANNVAGYADGDPDKRGCGQYHMVLGRQMQRLILKNQRQDFEKAEAALLSMDLSAEEKKDVEDIE